VSPSKQAHALRRRGPRWLRWLRIRTIRGRVIVLGVVPTVLLSVLLGALVWIVLPTVYQAVVVSTVRDASLPAVRALERVQTERRDSMACVAAGCDAARTLLDQRQRTDQALANLHEVIAPLLSSAPPDVATAFSALNGVLNDLPATRRAIDTGATTAQQVYDYYTKILDTAAAVFDTQARIVPDGDTAQGARDSTTVFDASEQASRAGALIATALAQHALTDDQFAAAAEQIGAYHHDWDLIAPHLAPDVRAGYVALKASPDFADLRAAETAILAHGPWTARTATGVPVSAARWQDLTGRVTTKLAELTFQQADAVTAASAATAQSREDVIVGLAVAVFVVALVGVVYAVTTGRGLLTGVTAMTVEVRRRPDLVRAHIDARLTDPQATPEALPLLRSGFTELGWFADAFNDAERDLVRYALDAAAGREGVRSIVSNVVLRIRPMLDEALRILTQLEQRQEDPDTVERLFRLDHLATRLRRFADTLTVHADLNLSSPTVRPDTALMDIVTGAVSEAERYDRADRIPSELGAATIKGPSAEALMHALAELIDNAIKFTPGAAKVAIQLERNANGISVEIMDRGPGIPPDQRATFNDLLLTPPDDLQAFQQKQLGLITVARLAARLGVQVTLHRSPTGGVTAFVLIPHALIVTMPADPTSVPTQQVGPDRENYRGVLPGVVAPGALPPTASAAAPAPQLEAASPWFNTGTEPGHHAADAQPHPPIGASGGRRALPQRTPQRALNANLRGPAPDETTRTATDQSASDIAPEALRARLQDFDAGTRRAEQEQARP
jgi:signal transduction histidine kinase